VIASGRPNVGDGLMVDKGRGRGRAGNGLKRSIAGSWQRLRIRAPPAINPDPCARAAREAMMSVSKRNTSALEETFSLTVDQYGRLWLHTKLDGLPVAVDLAEKNAAFEIMAAAMRDNGFERRAASTHDDADNDDHPRG
jgi:hypothetical protein